MRAARNSPTAHTDALSACPYSDCVEADRNRDKTGGIHMDTLEHMSIH
eukprot:SAG22_NODE_13169_length_416_cov_1.141956_1_plen_47_part_10